MVILSPFLLSPRCKAHVRARLFRVWTFTCPAHVLLYSGPCFCVEGRLTVRAGSSLGSRLLCVCGSFPGRQGAGCSGGLCRGPRDRGAHRHTERGALSPFSSAPPPDLLRRLVQSFRVHLSLMRLPHFCLSRFPCRSRSDAEVSECRAPRAGWSCYPPSPARCDACPVALAPACARGADPDVCASPLD